MKKAIALVGLLLVIVLALAYFRGKEDTWLCEQGVWVRHGNPSTPMPSSGCGTEIEKALEPTNFSEIGTVIFNNPGLKPSTPYLIYEEPGSPAIKKELILDERSFCSAKSGGIPCIAMSVTLDLPYEGKRVVVEGVRINEEAVLVHKMRAVEDGDLGFVPPTGLVYVPWPVAIEAVKNCSVSSIFQNHAGDVSLTLKDGREWKTVEPVIDEIFRIVDENKTCGDIVLGTE